VAALIYVVLPTGTPGGGTLRHEADVYRIEHIEAAIERSRALRHRLEQVAQRRHGAVVQIRGAHPHTIERRRTVAGLFHHVLALDAHFFDTPICFGGGGLNPGVHPLTVSADFVNRNRLVRVRPAHLVTFGAVAGVDELALP